ncbi:MAG TPA: cbb3-type cytochrome c oxidase subunit I [Candidatus Dormibacteraeota bacterium]|nr:cbb3-type cytochrome c oxidase subunit I [Candidatus Dormibacteraeota bacterium]
MASAPVDIQLRQSCYTIAHIHCLLFGGGVFASFADIYRWLPKITALWT